MKRFINIDNRDFVRAKRYYNNYQFDDLWYETPEDREVAQIYNIEDIFNLRILFGLESYEEDPAPEQWG